MNEYYKFNRSIKWERIYSKFSLLVNLTSRLYTTVVVIIFNVTVATANYKSNINTIFVNKRFYASLTKHLKMKNFVTVTLISQPSTNKFRQNMSSMKNLCIQVFSDKYCNNYPAYSNIEK